MDIGHERDADIVSKISESLPRTLKIVAAPVMTYDTFIRKFTFMRDRGRTFIDGEMEVSPSVQCRINPWEFRMSSLHTTRSWAAARSGISRRHIFLPAANTTRYSSAGLRICRELQEQGVLGRFSIDFYRLEKLSGWVHYAIEINLRKGGTTHPYLMLQFSDGWGVHMNKGLYMINGQTNYYFESWIM